MTSFMVTSQTDDAVKVLNVKHWTDRLFSFSVERPASFRFRSGEFVMLGLLDETGKPLLRAYSIASPSWDEKIEFYSIKVPDGPLTSRLQHLQSDEYIIMKKKPVGTLVLDALIPGKRIYLVATGTGIAPFSSLVRDPEIYEQFEQVMLIHTCRDNAELAYGKELVRISNSDPLIAEMAHQKLVYLPTTTREKSDVMGRATDLMRSGELFTKLSCTSFSPEEDRVMICGSMAMNSDMKSICEEYGLIEGANSHPGHYVLEKAFVG
ncbi:MAG: ferredoxin--NADP reductase [Alphaproteobacteria bacterium]|nr:ferredoxin--NADP reductase [Alphaproteobacteria bacterium]